MYAKAEAEGWPLPVARRPLDMGPNDRSSLPDSEGAACSENAGPLP